jgi:hypothetical protein
LRAFAIWKSDSFGLRPNFTPPCGLRPDRRGLALGYHDSEPKPVEFRDYERVALVQRVQATGKGRAFPCRAGIPVLENPPAMRWLQRGELKAGFWPCELTRA